MNFITQTVFVIAALAVTASAEVTIGEPMSVFLESDFQAVHFQALNQGGLCLSEHNSARASNGKAPLTYDTRLETAAKNHNQVMTSKNCFSHQCPGEPSLGDRVTSAGYKWWGVAENIAAGQADCKSAVNGWMKSDGHRKNILGDYNNIGCAFTPCKGCNYPTYWTCVFGRPR